MYKKTISSLFMCLILSVCLLMSKLESTAVPASNAPLASAAPITQGVPSTSDDKQETKLDNTLNPEAKPKKDNGSTKKEEIPVLDHANIPMNVTNETTPREGSEKIPPRVVAPALQYLREDYPSAFLSKDDYSIKLNTTTRYKLRCSDEITAVAVGDSVNLIVKENDEPDEEKMLYELAAPKDIIVKTKYETYSYMQIYTESSDLPVTVLLSVNSKNDVPSLIKLGSCSMYEDLF